MPTARRAPQQVPKHPDRATHRRRHRQYRRSGLQDSIRQCDDPALLRRSLERQNKLAGSFDFLTGLEFPFAVYDQIGLLRALKGVAGIEVQYQDLTGRELTARKAEAEVAYTERSCFR